MRFFRRLPLGLLLLFILTAFAADTAAQGRQGERTLNAAKETRTGPIVGGAAKGAIAGAVAGAVGAIAAARRARATPEDDDERNLKEPGRPHF